MKFRHFSKPKTNRLEKVRLKSNELTTPIFRPRELTFTRFGVYLTSLPLAISWVDDTHIVNIYVIFFFNEKPSEFTALEFEASRSSLILSSYTTVCAKSVQAYYWLRQFRSHRESWTQCLKSISVYGFIELKNN